MTLIAFSSIDSVSYNVDRDSKPRTNRITPGTKVQTNSRGTTLTRFPNSKLDKVIQLILNKSLERMNVISNRV